MSGWREEYEEAFRRIVEVLEGLGRCDDCLVCPFFIKRELDCGVGRMRRLFERMRGAAGRRLQRRAGRRRSVPIFAVHDC